MNSSKLFLRFIVFNTFRSSYNSGRSSSPEEQRRRSLPCGLGVYSFFPSEGRDEGYFGCRTWKRDDLDRDTFLQSSQLTENCAPILHESQAHMERGEFSQYSTRNKYSEDHQSNVGREKLSKSVEGYKWFRLTRKCLFILLSSLLAAFLVPIFIFQCFDFSHQISESLQSTYNQRSACELGISLFNSKFEMGSSDIFFNRTVCLTDIVFKKSRKTVLIPDAKKLPAWENENLNFSISAIYLTPTIASTETQTSHLTSWVSSLSHTPRISWASTVASTLPFSWTPGSSGTQTSTKPPDLWVPTLTHTLLSSWVPSEIYIRSYTCIPTPWVPAPWVPAPWVPAPWAPSIANFEGMPLLSTPPLSQVPSILNDRPLSEVISNPPSATIPQNQAMSDSECDDFPSCVHDRCEVTRHCTYCHVWVCSSCSRPNYVSTMGIEHLMLKPATLESSSNTRVLPTVCNPLSRVGYSQSRRVYSIDLNWWQKHMKHEFASPPPEFPTLTTNSKMSHNSRTSLTARMTLAVIETRLDASLDSATEYLNNHYYYHNPYSPMKDCIIHTDVLRALREDVSAAGPINVEALKSLCDFKTQTVRFQGVLSITSLTSHVVRDDGVVANTQSPEKNSEDENALSEDEYICFGEVEFFESEDNSTDQSVNHKQKKKEMKLQSKTKGGVHSKIADIIREKNESPIHTSRAQSRTNRQTSTSRTQINPTSLKSADRQTSTTENKINTKSLKSSNRQKNGSQSQINPTSLKCTLTQTGSSQNQINPTSIKCTPRKSYAIQSQINPNPVEATSVCATGGARPKTSTQKKKSKKAKRF